ncbi:hypothetical protein JCM19992_29210 [Thermostilla marina]
MGCRVQSGRLFIGALVVALCGLPYCTGCGNSDGGATGRSGTEVATTPTSGTQGAPDPQDDQVHSAVVRKLLEALDDSDASPDEKRAVRELLLEADKELIASLEGNARRPDAASTSGREQPYSPPKAIADARARLAERGIASPQAGDEAQTVIVRSLLQLLDEITTPDDDSEDVVRDALLNADAELREALGNRKTLIQRANRRAPSPRVFNPSPARSGEGGPQNTSPHDDSETDSSAEEGSS